MVIIGEYGIRSGSCNQYEQNSVQKKEDSCCPFFQISFFAHLLFESSVVITTICNCISNENWSVRDQNSMYSTIQAEHILYTNCVLFDSVFKTQLPQHSN